MASVAWNNILRHLRRLGATAEGGDISDATLLRRFASGRDESAFAAVVGRHGPMVWGVCRRRLANVVDAEDAFQATFLVLVRKAGAIHRPETLGPWLHGVAYRVSARLRATAVRRRTSEPLLADPPAAEAVPEADWRDLRSLLDEEVNRLPERYRVPFVLCHLNGLTNEEAARQLGCPKGTVLSRLSRARERLREQLTRRGVGPCGAGLATAVAEQVGSTPVPAALSIATARLGKAFAAGTAGALTRTTAIVLTEGVVSSMFFEKLKLTAAVVLALALIGAGGGFFSRRGEARIDAPDPPPKSTALGQAPEAKALESKPPQPPPPARGQQLSESLARVTKFEGFDDPKTTLQEALDQIANIYNIQFEVNETAFRDEGKEDVLKMEVAARTPVPPMHATLANILRRVLTRIGGAGATYVIRKDFIEITTSRALAEELHLTDSSDAASQPLVYEDFNAVGLPFAFRKVGNSCRENVVLDPQAEESIKTRTVTTSLHNVRGETAVRTLAAVGDLEVVRLDNVLYVTTPEKAAHLRESWKPQTPAAGKGGKKDR